MKTPLLKALLLIALTWPAMSWAHSMSQSILVHDDFWNGLVHLFTDIDHLLTMALGSVVVVGICRVLGKAWQLSGQAVALMTGGGVALLGIGLTTVWM